MFNFRLISKRNCVPFFFTERNLKDSISINYLLFCETILWKCKKWYHKKKVMYLKDELEITRNCKNKLLAMMTSFVHFITQVKFPERAKYGLYRFHLLWQKKKILINLLKEKLQDFMEVIGTTDLHQL